MKFVRYQIGDKKYEISAMKKNILLGLLECYPLYGFLDKLSKQSIRSLLNYKLVTLQGNIPADGLFKRFDRKFVCLTETGEALAKFIKNDQ